MNEKALSINYNRELAVVQANELVRSKQDDLSLLEAKLVRLAVSQVLKDDSDLSTYSCDVVDLATFLGISKDNIYRDIQELSKNLMKKSIYIKEKGNNPNKQKKNYKIFHWIDFVEYKDGTITFKLSESLKPYLVGLDELFTLYGYEAIIELPTNYSIRLYELLASYERMIAFKKPEHNYTSIVLEEGECIFTIDWLREYFNCDNKYPNTGDFIRRVIDSSISAIKENTLMNVSYRTERKGRTITHIIFKISSITEDKEAFKKLMDKYILKQKSGDKA